MSLSKRDNYALTSGALAIGTTVQKVKTAKDVNYVINGRAYLKAATDDLFTLSGTTSTARQVTAFYLWLDTAGAASVTQSAIKEASTSTSTTTRYVAGSFGWPEVTDKALIGAVVVTNAGSSFIPGTTSLATIASYINAAGDYGTPITY